ncbi:pyridoxamine 5'-phosphate oxidase [Nocardia mangyaensis]|uniref:pyridoxamine 5'-phosphate oxidase n=1 Tax=Nocardia mangyaensis TaxID=2213200 RepID=UPI0026770A97|nr:pyridoxamine 5'-phosphate oxidase [Nocardia mangyaensis]MDO3650379.1 pyridoxamine 5'-phosphate oxidase [Nocardia mangyaensis]
MRELDPSAGAAPDAVTGASSEALADAVISGAVDLRTMRVDYGDPQAVPATETDLDESWVSAGWEPLLRRWIDQARTLGVAEPNAMVLATVSLAGPAPRPVARTVLCKGLSPEGVTFYTNYDSAKGNQLAADPYAAATFLWPALARQVHVRGVTERVPAEVTEAYWQLRPRESRLGAWASRQSRPAASRAELDQALADTETRFAEVDDIPVPPFWGGYLLRPDEVEFWQGRRGRLHNRIVVRIDGANTTIERLQP